MGCCYPEFSYDYMRAITQSFQHIVIHVMSELEQGKARMTAMEQEIANLSLFHV